MKQDIFGDTTVGIALNSTAISTDTTTNGATITVGDALGLMFLVRLGAFSAGVATPLIQDSPNGTDWTAVADDYLSGTEAGAALTAANTVKRIGYLGKQPYVRLCIVSTSSGNFTALGEYVTYPVRKPAAQ